MNNITAIVATFLISFAAVPLVEVSPMCGCSLKHIPFSLYYVSPFY
jgi:hypothetical protein